MGTLFKIAFRNIMRNKRRTITSAFIIAFGILFFIFYDSIMRGMDKGATDNMIQLSTSSVKVYTNEYYQDKRSFPLKYGITIEEKIKDVLKSNSQVTGITPRVEFLGELSNSSEYLPIVGKVIDRVHDAEVFKLKDYLMGEYFSENSEREIILGKKLAKELDVGVDDYITLYALTRYESRNADDFKVVGILNTTDPAINNSTALITYEAGNDLLDLENLKTELNISIKKQNNFKDEVKIMEDVKLALQKEFPQLKVLTFKDLAEDFIAVMKQKQGWSWMMIFVVLLIAAVGIFNTVMMSVYERIKEIGVLRAHGLKSFDLQILFLYEGFLTGVLGGIFGVFIASAVNIWLVYWGIPIDAMVGEMDVSGLPVWGTIYGQWSVSMMISGFLFGVIVATLAGVIPSRKAAKMKITEALRYV